MLEIGETLVSLELLNEQFCCDIAHCHGICCEEGDSGAPLLDEEVDVIEKLLPQILDSLSPAACEVIGKQGVSYVDVEGDRVTSIVDGRECVFACKDEQGTWQCAIEKAWEQGKTSFQKPISCHLYPVRLHQHRRFLAVEYHQWDVCRQACRLGRELKLPLYRFLKGPLIRRFGQAWYDELDEAAKAYYASDYYKNRR